MSMYTKSHERDENRKMNQGFENSLFALFLCWLPLVGLLLAMMGFFRQIVRLTDAHRVKHVFFSMFCTLVLIICIGALTFEGYYYINHPDILNTGGHQLWEKMTGEKHFPWEPNYDLYDGDGVLLDYTGEDEDGEIPEYPDEYYNDDSDYDADFDDSELAGFPEDDEDLEEAPADIEIFQMIHENIKDDPITRIQDP